MNDSDSDSRAVVDDSESSDEDDLLLHAMDHEEWDAKPEREPVDIYKALCVTAQRSTPNTNICNALEHLNPQIVCSGYLGGAFSALVECLASCSNSVTSLCVRDATKLDAARLTHYIAQDKLEALQIANTKIEDCQMISALAKARALKQLSLINAVGRHANSLFLSLNASQAELEVLDLSNNNLQLSIRNGKELASYFKSASALVELNLSWNCLRSASVILANLAGLRLKKLNLSYCGLGDDTSVVLAELISQNKELLEVDISHNCLAKEFAMALANAIPSSSLKLLDIGFQPLGTAGTFAIIQALGGNVSMSLLGCENTVAAGDECEVLPQIRNALQARKAYAEERELHNVGSCNVIYEFPQRSRSTTQNSIRSRMHEQFEKQIECDPKSKTDLIGASVFGMRLIESSSESYYDDPTLMDAAFDADWDYILEKQTEFSEYETIDKNGLEDLAAVMRTYYRKTYQLFKYYCADRSGRSKVYRCGSIDASFLSRDAFSMSESAYYRWIQKLAHVLEPNETRYKLDESRSSSMYSSSSAACMHLSKEEVYEIFRLANVEADYNPENEDNALERFEFLEITARLAIALFYCSPTGDSGSCTSATGAYVAFMDLCTKTAWHSHMDKDKWRQERLYQQPVLDLLEQHQAKLLSKFKDYAQDPLMGYADLLGHDPDALPEPEAGVMDVINWIDFLDRHDLLETDGEGFGQLEAVRAFAFSKVITEDEMVSFSDHKRATFTDFLEMLCRTADARTYKGLKKQARLEDKLALCLKSVCR